FFDNLQRLRYRPLSLERPSHATPQISLRCTYYCLIGVDMELENDVLSNHNSPGDSFHNKPNVLLRRYVHCSCGWKANQTAASSR
ncbi:MAG: hypothetical protein WBJ68_04490, partial [Candidatus Dechloromonas phosphoritropha]